MAEKIELPIQITDIDCVTACWIHNRLAIIKTSPYYRDWVAAHYNLVGTGGYLFEYEDVSPSYHEEILQRKPVHLFHFTKDNIVAKLKGYLKDGYYIIMTLKQYKDRDYMHEVVFYGFDDNEKHFMAVGIEKRIFKSMLFEYSYMEDTIEEVKKNFLDHERRGMVLSIRNQYPVTAMKLNPSFNPDNCVFEAYEKLDRELRAEFHDVSDSSDYARYQSNPYANRYIGISCLDIFKQMLEAEIKGEEFPQWFKGITRNAKILSEYHIMMKKTMDYIIENWDTAITDYARTSAAEYNECNMIVAMWLNICLKYEYTQDKKLLMRIVEEIPDVFSREKQCLETFINNGIDWKKFNKNFI